MARTLERAVDPDRTRTCMAPAGPASSPAASVLPATPGPPDKAIVTSSVPTIGLTTCFRARVQPPALLIASILSQA